MLAYEDRALYTTWDISLQHIQIQNTSAAKLLRLWAYFDNQDLWYKLLAAGSHSGPEWFSELVNDELDFNGAIRLLCDHGLIERLEDSDGYGMHTCVHAWAAHVLNAEKDILMARLALICVGSSVPAVEVPKYWTIQRRILSHARQCSTNLCSSINLGSQNDDKILNAVNSLGNLYADQGKTNEAEEMFLRALTGYEKVWGAEHTSTLDTVNSLGNLYKNQGKMKEAEDMYLRALTGYEKTWGPEHKSTLDTVNNVVPSWKLDRFMLK